MLKKLSEFSRYDLILVILVTLLVLIGVLAIYSAGFDPIDKVNNGMYKKQIVWFVIGLLIMTGLTFFDYKLLGDFSLYIYGGLLLVLVLTTFFGANIRNTRAWINFGFFLVQPSEFMKLGVVILLAKYIEIRERDLLNFRELLIPTLLTMVPVIFILVQPDFGTAMIFIPVLFTMLFVGGADITHLVSIVAIAAISLLVPVYIVHSEAQQVDGSNPLVEFIMHGGVPFGIAIVFFIIGAIGFGLHYLVVKRNLRWIYIPSLVFSLGLAFATIFSRYMKDYQKKRILVYLNPDLDPHGSGYNVIQSKIAIGSGGFFGKGFLQGSQTQLGFLPEKTSDFVFSLIGEEWGFLGAVVVTGLLLAIVYRGARIAMECNDKFASMVAVGISSIFFFHALINIGMTIGIMPVTGLPLCFVSYGGSNFMMSMIGVGILINLSMNRT